MKTFLIKNTLFFLSFIILMSLFALASDKGLSKTMFYGYEMNETLTEDFTADLIVLGNSRAEAHIVPHIVDSIFNLNSYNLGLSAIDMKTQKARYELYSEKHSSQYIIYCVDDHCLVKSVGLPNIPFYFPYLSSPVISDLMRDYDALQWYDFYNPFSKYLYQPHLIYGLLEFTGLHHFSSIKQKGYLENDSSWDEDSFNDFKAKNPEGIYETFSEDCFFAFDNFLNQEKAKNTKIVLVFTPQYIEGQKMINNRQVAVDFFEEMALKYDIPYLDYSSDSICLDKNLFYNAMHLNRSGAEYFTRLLCRDLKNISILHTF